MNFLSSLLCYRTAYLARTGGMVGSVGINITVTYYLPGSSLPPNEVALDCNGDVTIAAGSRSTSVVVRIAENGFIKLGAAFKAELRDSCQITEWRYRTLYILWS